MSKNLVISGAFGFGIKELEFFLKSLRKYYKDDICFAIGTKDHEIEKELKKFGCICIKTNIDKRDIQLKRYEVFFKFLENKNYKNILFCDSRDIYFQSNPFEFDYEGQINFFLEDKKIKDCPYNSNWILKTYGKSEFTSIKEKIILCSGTVLGSSNKMKEYLDIMKKNILKYKYKKKIKYLMTLRRDPEGRGCDQGHANYIVHKDLIKDKYFYKNNDGPFATVFYLDKLNFDDQSRLINKLGKPYLTVHQYDKRWSEFSSHVEKIKNKL